MFLAWECGPGSGLALQPQLFPSGHALTEELEVSHTVLLGRELPGSNEMRYKKQTSFK